MLKKSYSYMATSIFLSTFLSQSCLGETAQPVTIPGYNPNAPVTLSTPQTAVSSAKPASPSFAPTVKLATPGDLADMVTSVDFTGWSTLSQYLWTCTPSNFTLVPANAKNKLQIEFDSLTRKNQIPTLSRAKDITAKLTQLVNYSVKGLYGYACHITVYFPQTDTSPAESLNCFFAIRDARYLSQLASSVAESNGKSDLVPDETLAALTDLMANNCKRS